MGRGDRAGIGRGEGDDDDLIRFLPLQVPVNDQSSIGIFSSI